MNEGAVYDAEAVCPECGHYGMAVYQGEDCLIFVCTECNSEMIEATE